MPRRFTPDSGQVVHLTIRCNNQEFLLNLSENFSEIISWLNTLPLFFSVKLHHVLVMSNHFHILATPEKNNMGQAMSYLLTNLSKYLNFVSSRKNHIFGDRYRPTIIKDKKHLINAIRYIYQNPVLAKMVSHIREYPYSSLGFYIGESNHGLIIQPDIYTNDFLDSGAQGIEIWYNYVSTLLNSAEENLLKQSFKRKEFKFSKKQMKAMPNSSSLVL